MIRNLKWKFILINMSLVTLVLVIVFAAICFFSYDRMSDDSYEALQRILSSDIGDAPPKLDIGDKRPRKAPHMLPMFSVTVDDQGIIRSTVRENVAVSDALISKVTADVLAGGRDSGVLMEMKLRYLMQETATETRIAFADMSRELETLSSLLGSLTLAGAGGLAGFFLISLFLSRWALQPAEKAWKQQRQFVADASHELKTPLTVILANTGILLAHPQDTIAQQAKWVEYTQAEAKRMTQLVEDLLFLAKSDGAQAPLAFAEVNLTDVVWSCLLPFESVAYEQGVTLVSSAVAPDIRLTGCEGQLKQLIMILLDNACKYAGKNGTVAVSLEQRQDQIRLSVTNTGDPIPPAHLDRLFERFYRADSSRVRDTGGYGLGLSIAKTIVENHRGRIHVLSRETEGTAFTVELPLKHPKH